MSTLLFRALNFIYVSLCIAGFLCQVSDLTATYFLYETVTKVTANVELQLKAPALHFCPRYIEVLDISRYNREKKASLDGNISDGRAVLKIQSTLTVDDIFEYTPPNEVVMKKCVIREATQFEHHLLKQKECYVRFNVTKYYMVENICYKFELIPKSHGNTYTFNRIAYALHYAGLFFAIDLNQMSFSSMRLFKSIATTANSFPENGFVTTPYLARGPREGSNSTMFNVFTVYYHENTYSRLPPPYDTKCRDYLRENLRHSRGCINTCMSIKSLRTLDRVIFSQPAIERIAKKHISSFDLKNKTFRKQFYQITEECELQCSQLECKNVWTLTTADSQLYDGDTRLFVQVPRQPSFTISHEPKVTIEEFVLFVASCFGSWFGLSAIALNPLDRLKKFCSSEDMSTNVAGRNRTGSYSVRRLIVEQEFKIRNLKKLVVEQRINFEFEQSKLLARVDGLEMASNTLDYFEYIPPQYAYQPPGRRGAWQCN